MHKTTVEDSILVLQLILESDILFTNGIIMSLQENRYIARISSLPEPGRFCQASVVLVHK